MWGLQSILEGCLERGRDEELSRVNHMQISLSDLETSDILSHLPSCVQFIREALLSGGRILVHCMAGVSRSATVPPLCDTERGWKHKGAVQYQGAVDYQRGVRYQWGVRY
jgi:Dual specificity phosphatase, catalytic domain